MTLPPLSLYVHIPWCVRKCPYCDFNSHETERIPEDSYVAALCADMSRDVELAYDRPLQSVFFGGGTPSLFSGRSIARILNQAEKLWGFVSSVEITLEANPGTAEYHALNDYRAAGVNRLSLGVQSFQDHLLQKLGRIHSAREAIDAVGLARKAGFDNLNLDLMHGLPGQSLSEALDDLHRAVALAPEHLSWYQLTIEPNTVFYRRPPTLPHEDTLDDIQQQGLAYLRAEHYRQYEVSAYARGDRQCKHNLNYWQFGDYLAAGAGAHGKITHPDGALVRYQKTRAPKDYLSAVDTTVHCNQLRSQDAAVEFMMNALRLNRGVPTDVFVARTGQPLDTIQSAVNRLINKGLMEDDPRRIQTTALGHSFLNQVLAEFAALTDPHS